MCALCHRPGLAGLHSATSVPEVPLGPQLGTRFISKKPSICPGVVHKGQTQGPRLKILWRIQGSQPEETPCELHRAVGAPSRQWVLGVGRAGGQHSDGGEERKGPETGMGRAEGRGREDMGGPAPARAGG